MVRVDECTEQELAMAIKRSLVDGKMPFSLDGLCQMLGHEYKNAIAMLEINCVDGVDYTVSESFDDEYGTVEEYWLAFNGVMCLIKNAPNEEVGKRYRMLFEQYKRNFDSTVASTEKELHAAVYSRKQIIDMIKENDLDLTETDEYQLRDFLLEPIRKYMKSVLSDNITY